MQLRDDLQNAHLAAQEAETSFIEKGALEEEAHMHRALLRSLAEKLGSTDEETQRSRTVPANQPHGDRSLCVTMATVLSLLCESVMF